MSYSFPFLKYIFDRKIAEEQKNFFIVLTLTLFGLLYGQSIDINDRSIVSNFYY
jgi:hypothetical protein